MPKFQEAGEEFKPDAAIEAGFSLVTCCMNRNDHLVQTLPTWQVHQEIDEIVIVDWSSEIPVAITLDKAGIRDPRIRILRVEDEGSWILSHAYNVGFRATTKDKIVKVDSDIILDAEFFNRNAMGVGKLTAGNWRQAEAGQSHVNGFFVTGREDLMNVNGFNERIVTYGWDDDDLYDRLTSSGVERVDVDPDTIRHIDHSDIRRIDRPKSKPVTGWDEVQAFPQFWISLNRQASSSSAPWDSSCPMTGFRLLDGSDGVTRLRRSHAFGVDTNLIGTRLERAEAAIGAIQDVFEGVKITASREAVDYALMTRSLKDAVAAVGSGPLQSIEKDNEVTAPIGHSQRKPKLIVDAQHGLGNRLRAIASGAAFAKVHDRDLIVRWVADEHCDCSFASLFDFDGAVEDTGDSNPENVLEVDLMSKAFREAFDSTSLVHANRDIVIQSAYRFTFGAPYDELERDFLRGLNPSADVQDLIDSVRSPNDIAVHVRMNGGAATDPHGDVPGDWSKSEDEIARRARSRSHYGFFFKRIDELLESSAKATIFLASDNSESYGAFTAKYQDRVTSLPRAVYDRSETQLKYALADVILLSRAPLLLGSNWSSFTEIAHSMSQNQKLEMSGQHF
ncbi:galactosyltransferase-related protein [Ruegeria sp. MALMAid1280]|uniref:galactosyltransferase-related protein n=1 Tax=Ruegeria sp. MALMAid1280 TaxID=3411634 RepID=UPI003BA187CF